jgi:hypothetical protein
VYLTNREKRLEYNNSGLQQKKLQFSEAYLRKPRINRRDENKDTRENATPLASTVTPNMKQHHKTVVRLI